MAHPLGGTPTIRSRNSPPPTPPINFYGGHRELGQPFRLGDSFKTIAKYVEHRANYPAYKLSELSQSDRDTLFSDAQGEFKIHHHGPGLRIEYVETAQVPGIDQDVQVMLTSPNYYKSLHNVDAYFDQLDRVDEQAEEHASDAYRLARALHHDDEIAQNEAMATYEASRRYHVKDVLPGRVGMRNPQTKYPLPIHARDGVWYFNPRTTRSSAFSNVAKIDTRISDSPLGFSDSSHVSCNSSTATKASFESSVPEFYHSDVLADLDEDDRIDGGVSLPLIPDRNSTPGGQLATGLMEQYVAQHKATKTALSLAQSAISGSAASIPSVSVTQAVPSAVVPSPVIPPPAVSTQVETSAVLNVGVSSTETSPSATPVPTFSPSHKSKLYKPFPPSQQPCKGIVCYDVPVKDLMRIFSAEHVLPEYWCSKRDKERFLRTKCSKLKYQDTQIPKDPRCAPAARNPVHIFIDLSNILIGFWATLKKNRAMETVKRVPAPPFGFKNFDTLLRRDRNIGTRIVAGSYGPRERRGPRHVDEARALGYDVLMLQRINQGSGRFVEQAVDEVLHLKMMETIWDRKGKEGTIILATGDAANGQYSDGFKKNVERALDAGWNVEVYAWSESMSDQWKKARFSEKWGRKFKLIMLDDFVEELFDMTLESIESLQ